MGGDTLLRLEFSFSDGIGFFAFSTQIFMKRLSGYGYQIFISSQNSTAIRKTFMGDPNINLIQLKLTTGRFGY